MVLYGIIDMWFSSITRKELPMFERIEYTVERIDGDYAYLKNQAEPDEELKCVARALLPEEISEGSKLAYEMFQYSLI